MINIKKHRRLKIRKSAFIILGIFIGLILSIININFKPNTNDSHIVIKKDKEYNLSLIMVGDALIHGAVYKDAYSNGTYDFKKMLTYIKPIVKPYDLAFYNQESIIGGKEIGLSTYPTFNSPDEIGEAMLDAGFNLISLANNHTLDRGERAITHSLAYWASKDVMVAGSYPSEKDRQELNIKTKNNISYTLLAYTTLTNGIKVPIGKEYYVNVYDKKKVKADILRVRDKVDILMVSMHWGNEYVHTPSPEQEEMAEYLSSLGVDIIIGHHPHVIEPIKIINNTVVIYSLGNFISAQDTVSKLTGMMASVNIKKKVTNDQTTISYSDIEASLIYTYYDRKVSHFKIIPYSNLTNTILPKYEEYYTKYSSIITNYDDTIMVTKINKD